EHLPQLAARARDLAVVRTLTSKEGNHQRARHLMHTGYPPQGGVDHPALGSILASTHGEARALPGSVSLRRPGEAAGCLSPELSPFPTTAPPRGVRFLAHAGGVDDARFATRIDLWRGLESDFAAAHPGAAIASGQKKLGEQAVAMMGPAATRV